MSEPSPYWIETFSGVHFDLQDFTADDIRIEDIAHSLAGQNRFTGHCRLFGYSTAQHSFHVSEYCPNSPLEGLLHDSAEAYISDVSRPLKLLLRAHTNILDTIEKKIEAAVFAKFGAVFPMPPEVKVADNMLLLVEKKNQMNDHCIWSYDWTDGAKAPQGFRIRVWTAQAAQEAFLEKFYELVGKQ